MIGSNIEMASLGENSFYPYQSKPQTTLRECRSISQEIDQIEETLIQIRILQGRSLHDADSSGGSSTSHQLDSLSGETMSKYRELTERVRKVKSSPDSMQPINFANWVSGVPLKASHPTLPRNPVSISQEDPRADITSIQGRAPPSLRLTRS